MRIWIRIILAVALAAMNAACREEPAIVQPEKGGTIEGHVTAIGAGIAGAVVATMPKSDTVITDANGHFSIAPVPPGTHVVTALKEGYKAGSIVVTVVAGATVTADIALMRDVPIEAPVGLAAASLSPTSVALRWIEVPGALRYNVSWKRQGMAGPSTTEAMAPAATLTGLTASTPYEISVSTVTVDGISSPATITWAGADRYLTDSASGTSIRIFEKSSPNGSALTLDPSFGGPRNVSVRAGTPGLAQLALYVYPELGGTPDSLFIGPAWAFPEYRVMSGGDASKIDSSVYISTMAYAVSSLDGWFVDKPVSDFISALGNIMAFRFFGSGPTESHGFFVRTGTLATSHYARILIVPGPNGLLRGSYPNRYLELQISYQTTPNLPFAKRSGRAPEPLLRAVTRR